MPERPPLFHDRRDAGRDLAGFISAPAGPSVVYGLARGGVPVANEVAAAIGAPLDALVVRKIGHPEHPEYALGALTRGHIVMMGELDPDSEILRAHVRRVAREADRLDDELHSRIEPLDPRGKVCILIDDGLATGATMAAACAWARAGAAERIVAAVPVAARESLAVLERQADEIVSPHTVDDLWAVSQWYRDFSPVGMDEVIELVRAARQGGAQDAIAGGPRK